MYCNKCGFPLDSDSLFCPKCGSDLSELLAFVKKTESSGEPLPAESEQEASLSNLTTPAEKEEIVVPAPSAAAPSQPQETVCEEEERSETESEEATESPKQTVPSGNAPIILKKAEKERKILVDYFAQEGLFDMEKQALVDVGWIGTSRLMINRILTNEGGQLVEGFYWGCAPESLAPRYGVFHSFYASSLFCRSFSSSFIDFLGVGKSSGIVPPNFLIVSLIALPTL